MIYLNKRIVITLIILFVFHLTIFAEDYTPWLESDTKEPGILPIPFWVAVDCGSYWYESLFGLYCKINNIPVGTGYYFEIETFYMHTALENDLFPGRGVEHIDSGEDVYNRTDDLEVTLEFNFFKTMYILLGYDLYRSELLEESGSLYSHLYNDTIQRINYGGKFDCRDNDVFPRSGFYIKALLYSPVQSLLSFDMLQLDLRFFFPIAENQTIGINLWSITGFEIFSILKAPVMDIRGYPSITSDMNFGISLAYRFLLPFFLPITLGNTEIDIVPGIEVFHDQGFLIFYDRDFNREDHWLYSCGVSIILCLGLNKKLYFAPGLGISISPYTIKNGSIVDSSFEFDIHF
ncbi:MAG: hypothetical protein JXB88_08935 [Spirochaetales bacterium]|nr:hypothetical protein [Spirochaetales bacterium]